MRNVEAPPVSHRVHSSTKLTTTHAKTPSGSHASNNSLRDGRRKRPVHFVRRSVGPSDQSEGTEGSAGSCRWSIVVSLFVFGPRYRQSIDKLEGALENGLRSRGKTKIFGPREYVELYT
jgi:hypothetical protein